MQNHRRAFREWTPIIFSGLSILGVIGTAIVATKNAPKAEQYLAKLSESSSKREKVKLCLKAHAPTIAIASGTIGCNVISAVLFNRRVSDYRLLAESATAAFLASDQAYKTYKKEVSKLNPEVDESANNTIATNRFKSNNEPGEDKVLFYEPLSDTYFWRSLIEVQDAEYSLNRNFILRGYADLNEFYEFLGLPQTNYGAHVGWSQYVGEVTYGYSWVDFTHIHHDYAPDNPDSPPYFEIHMPFPPTGDFDMM